MPKAAFRFYAELNDFLPPERRQTSIPYEFSGSPSVKDAIEALGVPHVEVDLIVVNGQSVDFTYRLQEEDRVAVYPVWEGLDISPVVRLRERPLRRPAFVADVHLGKLARLLRLLGLDTVHSSGFSDEELVTIAAQERRILVTRDRQLLKRRAVLHGYWVRSVNPVAQAQEVVGRFDLHNQVQPFTRCLSCNGLLQAVDKGEVLHQVPPRVARWREEYYRCTSCGKLYWQGTHFPRLEASVAAILGPRRGNDAR